MSTYVPVLITSIMCGISMLLMKHDKSKWEDITANSRKSIIVYCAIMCLITVGISAWFCTKYIDNGIIHIMKRLALLSILWAVASIDFMTYRIPNTYIWTGLIYRGILLVFEVVAGNPELKMLLLSEVIAAGAILLATFLCAICIKNSIGAGDIKLFFIMGLMLGTEGIWNAVFCSLLVSFILAAFLLITKKKNRKDAMPFGPAIAIGTYLSVCLTGV